MNEYVAIVNNDMPVDLTNVNRLNTAIKELGYLPFTRIY